MNNNQQTFKSLNIGETFRFNSERTFPLSGMKQGLCRKMTSRKYEYVGEDFPTCRVGTISVDVFQASE